VTDWRAADTAELCEHIVGVHHEFLRQSFPKVESLIGTVVRVHGTQEPALQELPHVFETIRAALEPHLASEETELFPAILAAAQGGPPVPEEILSGHEYEHAEVGAALVELRALCDDYDRRHARCNTHRAMLDALEELELDIHEHVHEENNILFPRAKRHELLPACCQGWVDEQGERWARARREHDN
ncbi:MAG: hemerythrin domain-containing protein, partial [Gaiellaceae bacterium]